MEYFILKSKIHRCRVTDKNLDYEGSITIDRDLMDAAGLLLNEKVEIYNVNNGNRFNTYVIEGKRGSGDITINGAAARLAEKNDLLIVVAFAMLNEKEAPRFKPKIVYVDKENKIVKKEN
jgi:aspartate 1-decarboxylase